MTTGTDRIIDEEWKEETLKQSTYLFFWALASIASLAIFVKYF